MICRCCRRSGTERLSWELAIKMTASAWGDVNECNLDQYHDARNELQIHLVAFAQVLFRLLKRTRQNCGLMVALCVCRTSGHMVMMLKWILNNNARSCKLHSPDWRLYPVGRCYERVDESWGSLKERDFRTWSKGCELVAKVFVVTHILLIEENAWWVGKMDETGFGQKSEEEEETRRRKTNEEKEKEMRIEMIMRVLSQPVHQKATYRCDDTRCCIIQFLPPDDEYNSAQNM